MEILHTILTIVQVILAIALVAIVTIQSGKSAGLSSTLSGAGETFFGKSGKTLDATLAKATKWVGGVFLVLTLALNLF